MVPHPSRSRISSKGTNGISKRIVGVFESQKKTLACADYYRDGLAWRANHIGAGISSRAICLHAFLVQFEIGHVRTWHLRLLP